MVHSFMPRTHAATFYNYKGASFSVDRFQARNMEQARAFALKRCPPDTQAVTINGPSGSIFFLTSFSPVAVDSSGAGFEGGCAGAEAPAPKPLSLSGAGVARPENQSCPGAERA